MQIWVDADAFPAAIRDIVYRAAMSRQVSTTLVANQFIRTPPSPFLNSVVVSSGADMADDYIAEKAAAGDLVITQDIPLAARVIENGAHVVNPHGQELTRNNIGQQLSLRNFMSDLRSAGTVTGGPAAYSDKDKQTFANALDRFITKHKKPA
ncbi:MAG: YaiI/YqxD family protein [Oceanospirillaceae bacterium]|nr:YaiI/YqxD family protein [Oceanospirillaceae bacterium]MCP5335406.1 YaiI/YqxD family protein [Oceanospirillaceae bacterium]MCP5351423.1 YaiI/YqxD family protein [Oceanospirillaceae bacterium]